MTLAVEDGEHHYLNFFDPEHDHIREVTNHRTAHVSVHPLVPFGCIRHLIQYVLDLVGKASAQTRSLPFVPIERLVELRPGFCTENNPPRHCPIRASA